MNSERGRLHSGIHLVVWLVAAIAAGVLFTAGATALAVIILLVLVLEGAIGIPIVRAYLRRK